MSDGETFLIIEPQALVQMDLTQALLEVCPDAQVRSVPSLEQARVLLEDFDGLTGAIVGVGFTALSDSDVPGRIEALGAWIVCLNGRHGDAVRAAGWHPLVRPFFADDVQRLVRSLLERSPCTTAAS